MQDYKHLFTKTALELTKSYINFMRQPWASAYFSPEETDPCSFIFGSFARGDERPDSDLDIMVTYLPNHRPGLFGISDLIEKLAI